MCDGSEINWMVWREFRIWQWLQAKWFEELRNYYRDWKVFFFCASPDGAQTYDCECKARWVYCRVHLRNPIRSPQFSISIINTEGKGECKAAFSWLFINCAVFAKLSLLDLILLSEKGTHVLWMTWLFGALKYAELLIRYAVITEDNQGTFLIY